MADIVCAGADVLRGRVHLPIRGAWSADLALDTATVPSGVAKFTALGGLTLSGTVMQADVFLDTVHVRLVGGAGGLFKAVRGAFLNAQLRDPLNAIAQATGETLSSTIGSDVLGAQLTAWTLQGSGAACLDALASAASVVLGKSIGWRVLADGTIWMGAETWPMKSLSAGDYVIEQFPAEGRSVIGAETPTLLPGVNLDVAGNLVAVDHWIEPHEVRTWAWTSSGMVDKFRAAARAAVGLDADPAALPRIDRLALYRAQVKAAASDGSTVDVQPEDSRIPAHQKVPIRVGIPGAIAIVQTGAVVLVGWERGDPARIYAMPAWEPGAVVTKVVIPASTVYLGAESGAQLVALENLVSNQLSALKTAIQNGLPIPNDGGANLQATILAGLATWPGSVAAAQVKAK